MYNTYNMGSAWIVAVDPADVDKTIAAMKAAGDTPYRRLVRSRMVKKE